MNWQLTVEKWKTRTERMTGSSSKTTLPKGPALPEPELLRRNRSAEIPSAPAMTNTSSDNG
ncbi:MAG: hypothetical protein ABI832_23580 [bacterium]